MATPLTKTIIDINYSLLGNNSAHRYIHYVPSCADEDIKAYIYIDWSKMKRGLTPVLRAFNVNAEMEPPYAVLWREY